LSRRASATQSKWRSNRPRSNSPDSDLRVSCLPRCICAEISSPAQTDIFDSMPGQTSPLSWRRRGVSYRRSNGSASI
jgi:hypothetical protein